MTWNTALELKQLVNNKILPANAFNDVKLSLANEGLQKATGKLSERLEYGARDYVFADGKSFSDLNRAYSIFKTAYDGLVRASSRKKISFLEKLGALGGITAGIATGGATVPATIGAFAAERVAKSTPVKLGVAFGLHKGERVISHEAIREVGRKTLFNLLSK